MVVRELLTRLGFQTDTATLNKYERGVTNIKSRADEAANSFRNMFAAFVGFQGLKSLANTADEMQSLESRIGQMSQTLISGADSFDTVSHRASEARQDLTAYATLYTRIGNASKDLIKDQDELLGVIDTVSQALVIGGSASSEQASSMLQLSQAFNKGKLDGDEFKSVMENMPVVFTRGVAAAMGFGDNLELFYKASSDGKLQIEGLVEAIKEISPEIRRQFESIPQTIGQTTTIMSNRWRSFIGRLNRDSGAVKNISDMMTKGWDKADAALEKMVKFFGGAANTVKFFGIVLAAALAPLTANLLLGAITTLASPIGLLIGGLFLVGLAIDDIMTYLRGGESVTGDFIKWLKEGSLGAGLLVGALTLLTAAFTAWGVTSVIAFTKAGLAALVFGANVLIGMLPVIALPALIIAGIVAVVSAIYMLWANWSDIWGWIKNIASETWKSVTDGFFSMVNKLKGYWNDFKSFFGLGASTTITAGKVAGAASSASGVAGTGTGASMNVTVNQELPAGTTKETADAAKNASLQVFTGGGNDILSRQMAAYSL